MSNKSVDKKQLSWDEIYAPYSLGYRIKLVSQLASRRFQEKLEPFGLTPFHWIVLCCLWEEDGLTTSTIGEKLQQVGGTLTGVLDRMAERSLIIRQKDDLDRRIYRIFLTEEAKQLKEVLTPIAVEIREIALRGISDAEREKFSALLDQAIANLI